MRAVGRAVGIGVGVNVGAGVGTNVAVVKGADVCVGMTVGSDEGTAVGASTIGALEESIPESKASLATTTRRNARARLAIIVRSLGLYCSSQILHTKVVRWSLTDGAALVHDATCPFDVHIAVRIEQ